MHRALLAVMVLATLWGCCKKSEVSSGKSDEEWMDDFIELTCERWDECMSDEMKASAPHMTSGHCEDDVRKALVEFNNGGLPSPCDAGEAFHGQHAKACYEQIRTSSCEIMLAGTWDTDACAQMCR